MAETTAAAARGLDGVVAAQTRMSHVDGQAGVLIIGGTAGNPGNVTIAASDAAGNAFIADLAFGGGSLGTVFAESSPQAASPGSAASRRATVSIFQLAP